jgi:hypothetical protein
MAGITLIFTLFDRNLVISLGAEVAKGDLEEAKEIVVIESQGHVSRPIGFTMNDDDEEDDEDDSSNRGRARVVGRTPGRGHL